MIWKIIFLLTCFKVLVKGGLFHSKSAKTDTNIINEEEYLEEKYSLEFVQSLNYLPTLDEKVVTIEESDVQLLTNDCYPDRNCLNKKNASVKKYHQKMQAMQCIHGLFVYNVLDDLEETIRLSDPDFLKIELQKTGLKHQVFLKSMLALLNVANWNAYDWQIEVFTFVEGLVGSGWLLKNVVDHFNDKLYKLPRDKVLWFISQCVHNKYLFSKGKTTSLTSTISDLVKGVHSQMRLLHKSGKLDLDRRIQLCTIRVLILEHLYNREDFIFDWSMYGYKLDMSTVKNDLKSYIVSNTREHFTYHQWELEPMLGNKYNALILDCIHLRAVHFVWFHLHMYHTLKRRTSDVNVLYQIWNTLVPNLKNAVRMFGFDENLYWSAMHIMMVDLRTISREVLEAREEYTRNYFSKSAEDLQLGSFADINRQLKEIKVPEDHKSMYDSIEANAKMLNDYIGNIISVLDPVDVTFIPMIVSAKGNEYFFKR